MGTVVGYSRESGYLVQFDNGLEEYVYAQWLEAAPQSEPACAP